MKNNPNSLKLEKKKIELQDRLCSQEYRKNLLFSSSGLQSNLVIFFAK